VLHKCPRRRLRIDGVRLDVLKGFLRGWAAQAGAHSAALQEMRELVERDGPALLATAAGAGLGLHARHP
jgi:4-alpha-glucanotransferase